MYIYILLITLNSFNIEGNKVLSIEIDAISYSFAIDMHAHLVASISNNFVIILHMFSSISRSWKTEKHIPICLTSAVFGVKNIEEKTRDKKGKIGCKCENISSHLECFSLHYRNPKNPI